MHGRKHANTTVHRRIKMQSAGQMQKPACFCSLFHLFSAEEVFPFAAIHRRSVVVCTWIIVPPLPRPPLTVQELGRGSPPVPRSRICVFYSFFDFFVALFVADHFFIKTPSTLTEFSRIQRMILLDFVFKASRNALFDSVLEQIALKLFFERVFREIVSSTKQNVYSQCFIFNSRYIFLRVFDIFMPTIIMNAIFLLGESRSNADSF